MGLRTASQASWAATQHPLYKFIFETLHADIDLSMSANLHFQWHCPEKDADICNVAGHQRNLGAAHHNGLSLHSRGKQVASGSSLVVLNAT
jgi:hypothetical protein